MKVKEIRKLIAQVFWDLKRDYDTETKKETSKNYK